MKNLIKILICLLMLASAGIGWGASTQDFKGTLNGYTWGSPGPFTTATKLTIATGVITTTQTLHTVEVEGEVAATDDLVTITAGTDGQILFLRAFHTDRTIVIKRTGNIITGSASDISLDSTDKIIELHYVSALSAWVVIGTLPNAVNLAALNLATTIINSQCTAAGDPQSCCTGSGTGTCGFFLPQGTQTPPTAESQVYWQSTTDTLTVGDGAAAQPQMRGAGTVADNAIVGFDGTTGNKVKAITSLPSGTTLVAPALGTPASGNMANVTGLPKVSSAAYMATTSAELAGVISDETGSGKQVFGTAPFITNPEIDAHLTADWTALPDNVSGTFVHNCGQAGVAATITLPTAAAGYGFVATVCEPSLTGTWKFLCSGTDHMTVDEVKGKHYVERLTTKVQGDKITCWTGKYAVDGVSSTTTLSTGSTVQNVANTAFKFVIAGTGYDKAADAVGIAPEAVTTAQNKYGGQMLEIGVDGTIHANAGANCAAGYDTEAEAAADADAHAVTAAHVKIGTVTAMRTNVAGFVWGTTGFNDGETTETFHSTAVHAFGYGWNCQSGKTAWTTD